MVKVLPLQKFGQRKIIRKFILHCLQEFGFEYDPLYDVDLDDLDGVYAKKGSNFFLALQDNSLIGTIGVLPQDKKTAKITRFYIKRELRRRGIGSVLFKKAFEFILTQGYLKVKVETTTRNKEAVEFFHKNGFSISKKEGISIELIREID